VKVLSVADNVMTNALETDVARLRSRSICRHDLPGVVVNAVPAWHSAVTPRHPHETSNAGEGRAATGPRMDADTSRHMPQGIDKHVATNESYA